MKKYLTSSEEMQKAYLEVELSEGIQRALRRQNFKQNVIVSWRNGEWKSQSLIKGKDNVVVTDIKALMFVYMTIAYSEL